MYAPAYGYGPGNPSAPFNSNPNPNGVPPQPQTPHQLQPGQPGQAGQPQHMMFNPQQYGVGPHQSPYVAGSPGMGGNAGGMGMMQNNGMAQMAGGHVPTYQTPYSSSPYGGNMPTSTAPPNMPQNFMPTTSNGQSFPMSAPNMTPQHQAQRMQPPPSSSTPTPSGPRVSPFGNVSHNTPPNATAQSQFTTPQNSNQPHLQTSISNQQTQGNTILTPQTPNFPPGAQGANAGSNLSTPLSPGSETREKERVTLLLEINRELLLVAMQLQAAQAGSKKEESASSTASPDGADKDKAEKAKAPASREYLECMRRLQSNLVYLAAIADRSHKPSSQIPAHPSIMTAPPLTPKSSQAKSPSTSPPKIDGKKEESSEEKKSDQADDEHIETLKEQYKKLQSLFPGVDPKKQPSIPATPQNQQQMAAMLAAKQQHDQKLQNEMMKQKMGQTQQQQALNAQQGQGQNR